MPYSKKIGPIRFEWDQQANNPNNLDVDVKTSYGDLLLSITLDISGGTPFNMNIKKGDLHVKGTLTPLNYPAYLGFDNLRVVGSSAINTHCVKATTDNDPDNCSWV